MNALAQAWLDYAWGMLWQSSIVIAVVIAAYAMLRKASASFRYALLCLVLIKLLLPPNLSLATGAGSWAGWVREQLWPAPGEQQTAAQEATFRKHAEIAASHPIAAPPASIPAPAAISAQTAPAVPLAVVLALGWIGCVVGMVLGLGMHAARVYRSFRAAQKVEDPETLRLLEACRADLGGTRRVPLYSLKGLSGPLLIGFIRPWIVIPEHLLTLDPRLLRPVLLHELAHVKRYDLTVNALQIVLQTLWFFHPGLWLTNWLIRRERERACDEMVLRALRGEREDYAESLIRVLEKSQPATAPGYGTLGILEGSFAMKTRFARILDEKRKISGKVSLTGMLVILVLAAVILPLAQTQEDAPKFPSVDGYKWLSPPIPIQQGLDESRRGYISNLNPAKGPVEYVCVAAPKGAEAPDLVKGFRLVAFDKDGNRGELVAGKEDGQLKVYTLGPNQLKGEIVYLGTEVASDYDSPEKRVSTAKSYMRALGMAIEAYYADHNAYPAWNADPASSADKSFAEKNPKEKWNVPTFAWKKSQDDKLATLTTPVSYLTHMIQDGFSPDGRTFRYYSVNPKDNENPSNIGWILWSAGWDGKYELDWRKYDPAQMGPNISREALEALFADVTYDPTNGSTSAGDIVRFKQ